MLRALIRKCHVNKNRASCGISVTNVVARHISYTTSSQSKSVLGKKKNSFAFVCVRLYYKYTNDFGERQESHDVVN